LVSSSELYDHGNSNDLSFGRVEFLINVQCTDTVHPMCVCVHQGKLLDERFPSNIEPPRIPHYIIMGNPGGFNVGRESFVEAFSSMDTHTSVFLQFHVMYCYLCTP